MLHPDDEISESPSQEVIPKTASALACYWGETGLEVLLSDLERLQRSTIHLGVRFRETDMDDMDRCFAHCREGLERFMRQFEEAKELAGFDIGRYFFEGISLQHLEVELSRTVQTLTHQYEQNAYEDIADKLEFGLLHTLHSWSRGLRSLKEMITRVGN